MISARHIKPSLPTWEISAYTATWISAVGYSIYSVYIASRKYRRLLSVHELEPGWFGNSRWRKDVSDLEWYVFSPIMVSAMSGGFSLVHVIGGQFFKKYNSPKLLPLFMFLLSAIYLSKLLGTCALLYLCLQPLVFFACARWTRRAILVYVVSISCIFFKESGPLRNLHNWVFPENFYRESYVASVIVAWVNVRCLSFCLDMLKGEVPSAGSIMADWTNMLAYCFYLPVIVSGPIVNYKEFHQGLTSEYIELSRNRARTFLLMFLRYLFWFYFSELLLHAFYFNALQDYAIEVGLEKFDLWTLAGIGYCMGQFFHLKYVIFYGLPLPFLFLDNVPAPSPPKCIGRIHLYSDMWRYFDNGLYKFIHKYFYRPVVDKIDGDHGNDSLTSRLCGSAVTFAFIYLWHGTQKKILIWTLLNFVGITTEAVARGVGAIPSYQRIERSYLSPRWRRRFYSLLGAPLFLMSILSNFYFFMDIVVGDIFMAKSMNSWPVGTPLTLFFMYCGAQTSYEMKNWEIRSRLLAQTN